VNVKELRNNKGPCAILGNGKSLSDFDLSAIAERMPVIGINRSWKKLETPWRCFVDPHHWADIRDGTAPKPDLTILPRTFMKTDSLPTILDLDVCMVNHLPLISPDKRHLMGFYFA